MWNYRIVKTDLEDGTSYFGVHEAFYDENGDLLTVTVDPVSPIAEPEEGVESLKETYKHILAAFDKPVIIKSDICA